MIGLCSQASRTYFFSDEVDTAIIWLQLFFFPFYFGLILLANPPGLRKTIVQLYFLFSFFSLWTCLLWGFFSLVCLLAFPQVKLGSNCFFLFLQCLVHADFLTLGETTKKKRKEGGWVLVSTQCCPPLLLTKTFRSNNKKYSAIFSIANQLDC